MKIELHVYKTSSSLKLTRTGSCLVAAAGSWRGPTHLVEVLFLLLDLGDVQQEAPHLTAELQRDSLVDPSHQLVGRNTELP